MVTIAQVLGAVAALTMLGATVWLLVRGLIEAGKQQPAVALVLALAILTVVAIIGLIITSSTGDDSHSSELATLAGTGLGALAGAVTAVWGSDRKKDDNNEEK